MGKTGTYVLYAFLLHRSWGGFVILPVSHLGRGIVYVQYSSALHELILGTFSISSAPVSYSGVWNTEAGKQDG